METKANFPISITARALVAGTLLFAFLPTAHADVPWLVLPGEVPYNGVLVGPEALVLFGAAKRTPGADTTAPAFKQITRATLASQIDFLEPNGKPSADGSVASLSHDATCAAGHRDNGFFTPFHAFRWTSAGGLVDIGTLEPASNPDRSSFATGAAQDCSVVVGMSDTNGGAAQHAFRWTPGAGMVDLGLPLGARANGAARALGISADGTVIVGDAEFPDNDAFSGFRNGAFRWVGGAFQSLGALEAGFFTVATAITPDASVIVGQGGVSVRVGNVLTNGSRAFRWTGGGGLQAIGPLPGDQYAAATGVSDNGAIVVGISSTGPITRGNRGFNVGTGAFRWTAATGIQDLRQLAIASGVDMTGITIISVTGISPDGEWITGAATTPQTSQSQTVPFVFHYCDGGSCGGPGPSFNAQGLWWRSPAGSGAGWGINFAHQGDIIFGTWFTYDANGHPLWLAVQANKVGPGSYAGDLFTTTGPPFNAVPFDPSGVVETTVGSATLTFADAEHATFAYTVDTGNALKSTGDVPQIQQTENLSRYIFASPVGTCATAQQDLALPTNYQDLWWNAPGGSEAGWGINFTHQGDIIFATWFTYDANGKPWWLAFVANRTGPGIYSGDVFTATGPPFSAVPWDPSTVVETVIGTATLTFANGNNATFDYTVNGVTQTKQITRQVFVPPGTVCQ